MQKKKYCDKQFNWSKFMKGDQVYNYILSNLKKWSFTQFHILLALAFSSSQKLL